MTTVEPFVPHPDDPDDDRGDVAAADPGAGAPPSAPGFGVEGEEPDQVDAEPSAGPGPAEADIPFRTPEVPGADR
jgi:hypothetical protein